MKKSTIVKILTSVVILAAVVAAAFVIYKNFFAKVDEEELDLDDLDDFDEDAEDLKREYVSIPFEEGASTETPITE